MNVYLVKESSRDWNRLTCIIAAESYKSAALLFKNETFVDTIPVVEIYEGLTYDGDMGEHIISIVDRQY